MSQYSKREFLQTLIVRYRKASHVEKHTLLDRVCEVCGYHRKYAIRLLKSSRGKYRNRGLATTRPGSLLKHHIPVKTNQWDETVPGFLEADTVAHCGTSMAGSFVFTVTATDWSEQRALWGKGERDVLATITSIERMLPFKVQGFDCDNGSEF